MLCLLLLLIILNFMRFFCYFSLALLILLGGCRIEVEPVENSDYAAQITDGISLNDGVFSPVDDGENFVPVERTISRISPSGDLVFTSSGVIYKIALLDQSIVSHWLMGQKIFVTGGESTILYSSVLLNKSTGEKVGAIVFED